MAHEDPEQRDDAREAHERLWLPLLIPLMVFLFAVLIIYGLSRIYLELNDYNVGDVTMATPLALGVALYIMFAAWFLASQRRVGFMQVAAVGGIAALALTGGSILAAVHEEEPSEHAVAPTATPGDGPAGAITVALSDGPFQISAAQASAPADGVTFVANNTGTIVHNLRVIKTDLAPEALPQAAGAVDETQVDVRAATADIDPGASEEATADLEAGAYVLICNFPGHYAGGMHTAFTVGPPAGGEPPPEGTPPGP